jgi:hypothetical protein
MEAGMERNGKVFSRVAAGALVLGAVWLLNANSRDRDNGSSSDAACDVCQEMMIGSFSCAVQGGELLAQVNFQGTGSLTPSPTGAGMVVLGSVAGGSVGQCESLASGVRSELDDADCALGQIFSPHAQQRVFDFACRGERGALVRAMGEVSEEVVGLSP